MLAIKLQRIGKKHQPSFRIVVAEKRSKLGGPPIEDLGSYNPSTKAVTAQKERVEHWIKSGAQPTPSAWNLLVKNGVVKGEKIAIKINKPEVTEAPKDAAPVAAAPAATAAPEAVAAPTETAKEAAATLEAAAAPAETAETPAQ